MARASGWRLIPWADCKNLHTGEFAKIAFVPGPRTTNWSPTLDEHTFNSGMSSSGPQRSACTQYLRWLREEGQRTGADMEWVEENSVVIWAHGRSDLYFFVEAGTPARKLACLQIMLNRDRQVFDGLDDQPDVQLEKFGVCVKLFDRTDPDEIKCLWDRMTRSVHETFPKVPANVLDDMRRGNLQSFENYWEKDKSKTGMLLRSFGTPFPFPLTDEAIADQTDNNDHVWHYNPCSAQMSVLPYLCITEMRDLYTSLTAGKGRAVVAPDSVKLAPGGKITPMHADEPGEDALVRYQIIFLREKKRLLRVLPASANTNEFIRTIARVYEGFSTINANPPLTALIERSGVGVPEGRLGVLVFRAGTIHWETESATPKAETFRIYSGIQLVGEKDLEDGTLSMEQLMKVAYMAEHGCDLASFSKRANKTHPLFVNAKGTQSWSQRTGPNFLVQGLLEATPDDHRTFLQTIPEFDLRLRGLRPRDVREGGEDEDEDEGDEDDEGEGDEGDEGEGDEGEGEEQKDGPDGEERKDAAQEDERKDVPMEESSDVEIIEPWGHQRERSEDSDEDSDVEIVERWRSQKRNREADRERSWSMDHFEDEDMED